MEKLADGLQKLNEDDLLHVVTLIHDNKSNETYTKNDVESECFFFWSVWKKKVQADGVFCRRRVPRRLVHAARFAGQAAVGVHGLQDGAVSSCSRPPKRERGFASVAVLTHSLLLSSRLASSHTHLLPSWPSSRHLQRGSVWIDE